MLSVPNFDDDAEKLGRDLLEIGDCMRRWFRLADADDVKQQIALELWRNREAIPLHPNPIASVTLVAKGRTLDMLREHGKRLRKEVSLTRWDKRASTQDTETRSPLTSLPEPLTAPDPYEAIAEREEKERMMADVWAVVGEFPPNKQYIFEQCMLQERSQKEVAEEIDLAYGTVRNYVSWIEKTLRDRFQRGL